MQVSIRLAIAPAVESWYSTLLSIQRRIPLLVHHHEHFFCLLFCLGVLQHSLRDRVVKAIDGAIRSDQRSGFHCAFHVHGRTGIGIMGKRLPDPKDRAPDPLSAALPLRRG